jgi:TPP-dependent pyruvate/acetoin dehydrogenase alpha subunit
MELKKNDYLEMYRWLQLIRRTEEEMVKYHHHSPITELPHSSIGQEAISVGSCYALRKEDQIAPSLRTRGAFLMKGVPSNHMMAGAFAKDIPETRGKNTSHHLGDRKNGILAGTGIVGSHLPVAAGAALAMKLQKKDNVVAVFFGDGATNRGDFHEAMNLAAIWNLPCVFICENNRYAISMSIEKSMKIKNISVRASSYGMPGVTIDGNDVLEVFRTTQEAYERARRGEGPTLIECETYRWRAHSERDPRDLRPAEEVEEWKEKDPVLRFKNYLLENDICEESELLEIDKSIEDQVSADIKFAEDLPYPPVEVLLSNVYSDGAYDD